MKQSALKRTVRGNLWNRRIAGRIIALLLAQSILLASCPSIRTAAAEPGDYFVYVVSNMCDDAFVGNFIVHNEKLYIDFNDALSITGMNFKESGTAAKGNLTLTLDDGYIQAVLSGEEYIAEQAWYWIDFVALCDKCRVRYQMVNDVLVTDKLPSYEEIRTEIDNAFKNFDYLRIMREDSKSQTAQNAAVVFDIFYNFKFVDYHTGNYTRKNYETVLRNVLVPDQDDNILDTLENTNTLLSKLEKIAKIENADWNDNDWFNDWYEAYLDSGKEYADFAMYGKAYSELSSKLKVSEALSVLEFVDSYGRHNESMVNGLSILAESSMDDSPILKTVSKSLVNYYSDNIADVGSGIALKILDEFLVDELLKQTTKKLTDKLLVNSVYTGVTRLVINECFGTQSKMDAAVNGRAYMELQKIAKDYWKKNKSSSSMQSLSSQRDVALLFLQAELEAYQAFGTADADLKKLAESVTSKLSAQLALLSSYTDDDMEFAENKLDKTIAGLIVSASEHTQLQTSGKIASVDLDNAEKMSLTVGGTTMQVPSTVDEWENAGYQVSFWTDQSAGEGELSIIFPTYATFRLDGKFHQIDGVCYITEISWNKNLASDKALEADRPSVILMNGTIQLGERYDFADNTDLYGEGLYISSYDLSRRLICTWNSSGGGWKTSVGDPTRPWYTVYEYRTHDYYQTGDFRLSFTTLDDYSSELVGFAIEYQYFD